VPGDDSLGSGAGETDRDNIAPNLASLAACAIGGALGGLFDTLRAAWVEDC
jgi:hypothetical protein